jgi:hypothetical protein
MDHRSNEVQGHRWRSGLWCSCRLAWTTDGGDHLLDPEFRRYHHGVCCDNERAVLWRKIPERLSHRSSRVSYRHVHRRGSPTQTEGFTNMLDGLGLHSWTAHGGSDC